MTSNSIFGGGTSDEPGMDNTYGMRQAMHMFDNSNEENSATKQWISFGMRLGVQAALHPFQYAKVLIQLGYEPIAPRPGRTFFGKQVMVLPNIFKYVSYIKRTDGFAGCYVGLAPTLIGTIVAIVGSEKIANRLGFREVAENRSNEPKTDQEFYKDFRKQLSRDVVLQVSAICLTQPFHVISVRMMAQIVGQETAYRSIRSSIAEIWSNEGICGLFNGLQAKLVCEISCLVLSSTTIYLIQKYFTEKRNDSQVKAFVQFVWSSIMYPMQVVSTCMAVTGSKLALGNPPHMKVYSSWTQCYNDLAIAGEHKRGSSLFFRYQTPVLSNYKMPVLPRLN